MVHLPNQLLVADASGRIGVCRESVSCVRCNCRLLGTRDLSFSQQPKEKDKQEPAPATVDSQQGFSFDYCRDLLAKTKGLSEPSVGASDGKIRSCMTTGRSSEKYASNARHASEAALRRGTDRREDRDQSDKPRAHRGRQDRRTPAPDRRAYDAQATRLDSHLIGLENGLAPADRSNTNTAERRCSPLRKNLKTKGGYDPPAPQSRPLVSLLKHS